MAEGDRRKNLAEEGRCRFQHMAPAQIQKSIRFTTRRLDARELCAVWRLKLPHEMLHTPNVARLQQSSLQGSFRNMGPQVRGISEEFEIDLAETQFWGATFFFKMRSSYTMAPSLDWKSVTA
jgi:hypothetical protein